MKFNQIRWILVLVVYFGIIGTASASGVNEELGKVAPRGSDAEQRFVCLTPENPVAIAVFFSGGYGKIGISGKTNKPKMKNKSTLFVKHRKEFARNGLVVAIMDAPEDQKRVVVRNGKKGMGMGFRVTNEHMEDVKAVISYLKAANPDLPLFLVGHSIGTLSVVTAGKELADEVDGIVLSSSVTKSNGYWGEKWDFYKNRPNALLDFPDMGKIVAPVLLLAHNEDSCNTTPPKNVEALKALFVNSQDVQVKMYRDGTFHDSGCRGASPHNFFSIRDNLVRDISKFCLTHIEGRRTAEGVIR